MRYLCVDIGNSSIKIAFFTDRELSVQYHFDYTSAEEAVNCVQQYAEPVDGAILSSVGVIPQGMESAMKKCATHYVRLSSDTPLPIQNLYATPQTLGNDRLAAAVGASCLYPGTNVLVIDAGTALTFDFVNYQRQYLGGTISPGLQMRFDALHHYTQKLPLLSITDEDIPLYGASTVEAISAGVQHGFLGDVIYQIEQYRKQFDPLMVILTGGDSKKLLKQLNNHNNCFIFAEINLVSIGLQRIVEGCI